MRDWRSPHCLCSYLEAPVAAAHAFCGKKTTKLDPSWHARSRVSSFACVHVLRWRMTGWYHEQQSLVLLATWQCVTRTAQPAVACKQLALNSWAVSPGRIENCMLQPGCTPVRCAILLPTQRPKE